MRNGIRWRTMVATLLVAGGIGLVAAAAFIYAGVYDVAASSPHWRLTEKVLEIARDRSIRTQASGIAVPSGLDDPARLAFGVDHFAAHCAVCHGAPGVPKGDIAKGLYPAPPNLAQTPPRPPAEVFWILKHGIKMTGMPAWSDHGDDELWATVAFLRKLPTLTEEEYAKLIMANAMRGGGHQHGEGMQHGQEMQHGDRH